MRYLLLLLLLAGCAAQVEAGNESSAVVSFQGSNEAEAFKAADAHCRQYGKVARVSSLPTLGSTATFDCVRP